MRIRWKAVVPLATAVFGVVSDPAVLGLLPDKAAHAIVGISAIAAIFFPALVTNKPKTPNPDSQVQYKVPSSRGF